MVGQWTTEGTHPAFPGIVVQGAAAAEWLEGERFIILRATVDHPDFPDSISMLGGKDDLHMHYFDSRGVARKYALTITDDGWIAERREPASSDDFSQRLPISFTDDDTMSGTTQISHDDVTWQDDLAITYRRVDE